MNEKSYNKMATQADQIRYEFKNQDTIVFRKNGAFWKAMGNSAVMMKHLGAKTKIRTFFDPVTEQEILELSVHMGQISKIKEDLGQERGEVLRDDDEFFIARLKHPIDSKKLREMKRHGAVKDEATADILTKRRKETPLAEECREIFKEAVYLVRLMNPAEAETLGRMILEAAILLQQATRMLSRNEKSEIYREIVDDAADDLQGLLLHVSNFTDQANRLARMGRSLNRIITRGSSKNTDGKGGENRRGNGSKNDKASANPCPD